MKPFHAMLGVIALAIIGTTARADEPPRQPLRPISACLRIDRINEWYVVDQRTAVVRTGPYRYLVKTDAICQRLGNGQLLMFRPSKAIQAVAPGSMCGDVGETVRSRDQPPCGVQSVSKIDKATFDNLEKIAIRRHHPTAQP